MRKNSVKWHPEASVLPIKAIQRGSLLGGILITLFSLAWCGFLLTSMVMGAIKEGLNIPMALLLLLFALPGFLFLYAGFSLLLNKREVFITRDAVTVRDSGLRKSEWTEPLESYSGVLKRTVRSDQEGSAGSTEHFVVLAHRETEKEITLFQSYSSTALHDSWRSFGTLLEMPLLEETEEGIVELEGYTGPRKIQRDEPAREKWQAKDYAESLKMIGPQVKWQRQGDAYLFRYHHYWGSWKAGLGIFLAAAMLLFARFLQEQMPGETGLAIFVWVMYGFLAIMILALWNSLTGYEELRIYPSGISYRKRSGRKREKIALQIATITSVSVKGNPRNPRGWPSSVVIEGGEDTIAFAGDLSRTQKIHLKEAVLAALMDVGKEHDILKVAEKSAAVLPNRFAASRASLAKIAFVVFLFFGTMAVLMYFAFDDKKVIKPIKRKTQQATRPQEAKTSRPSTTQTSRRIGNEQKQLALKRMQEERERALEARKKELEYAKSKRTAERKMEKRPVRDMEKGNQTAAHANFESIPVSICKDFIPVTTGYLETWTPFTERLTKERPAGILAEPVYQGENRLYGEMKLGRDVNGSFHFVLDQVDKPHPVLFFDVNRNGDLTDDGGPLYNQGSGRFAAEILLPMDQLIEELNTQENFSVWFFVNELSWGKGRASHYSKTKLKGSVIIHDKKHLAYIAETRINDADFTNDGIYVDLNSDGKIDRNTEYIRKGHIAEIDGNNYAFDITW